MVNPNLPEEILIYVFSRLPAKSIGKCRCLSKQWRTLLSTPQFIKLHLTRTPHYPEEEELILITPTHSVHRLTAVQNDVSKKLELPNTWTEVAGSCHGLVLLVNDEDDKLLINPTTLRHVKLPDCPQALKRRESFFMYGLGYDSLTGDYKVVTLSYYDTVNGYEPDCVDTFVDVYSVKSGVWERVGNSPYDHAVPEVASGVFVNGALHWLASRWETWYSSVITVFDLAREAFGEVPAPRGVDEGKFVLYRLVALRLCLCMIVARGVNGEGTDVWVMREYGVGDSWEKFSIEGDRDGCDVVKPLCFVGDGEMIVLLREEKRLVVYNFGEGSFRELVVDGAPAEFVDGSTYVESLVWPDFGYA